MEKIIPTKKDKDVVKGELLLDIVRTFYPDKNALSTLYYSFDIKNEMDLFSRLSDIVNDKTEIEELLERDRPKEIIDENDIYGVYKFRDVYSMDLAFNMKGWIRHEHWTLGELTTIKYTWSARRGKQYILEFK